MSSTDGLRRVSLGRPPREWVVGAWVLAAVSGLFAVYSLFAIRSTAAILGSVPPPSLWVGYLLVLALGAYVFVILTHAGSLEFDQTGVSQLALFFRRKIRWDDVDSLMVQRDIVDLESRRFPSHVQVMSSRPAAVGHGQDTPSHITFRVLGFKSPEDLQAALAGLVRGCPPITVSLDVLMLLGAVSRMTSWEPKAPVPTPFQSIDPRSPAVAACLREPEGREALTAPFEYFLGHVERARAQCETGLELEPNAWDLLLCRALCERSLGDEEAARVSLKAALEASPPPEVAPVLMHALEAA